MGRKCRLDLLSVVFVFISLLIRILVSGQDVNLPSSSPRLPEGDRDDDYSDELSRHDTAMDDSINPKQAKAGPAKAVDAAPLDAHHLLETLNGLVGILGGGASSLVFGLTGISLTDCALTFNGVDTSSLSCEDFLDLLSTCESLGHIQPLLKAAKTKLRHQHVPSNKPCSRIKRH